MSRVRRPRGVAGIFIRKHAWPSRHGSTSKANRCATNTKTNDRHVLREHGFRVLQWRLLGFIVGRAELHPPPNWPKRHFAGTRQSPGLIERLQDQGLVSRLPEDRPPKGAYLINSGRAQSDRRPDHPVGADGKKNHRCHRAEAGRQDDARAAADGCQARTIQTEQSPFHWLMRIEPLVGSTFNHGDPAAKAADALLPAHRSTRIRGCGPSSVAASWPALHRLYRSRPSPPARPRCGSLRSNRPARSRATGVSG